MSSDKPSCWCRDEKNSGVPIGFVLDCLIPEAATAIIQCLSRRVPEKSVAQLVGDVTGLSGARVSVVVNNHTCRVAKDRYRRKLGFPFLRVESCCERCRDIKLRESSDRNLQVLCETPWI